MNILCSDQADIGWLPKVKKCWFLLATNSPTDSPQIRPQITRMFSCAWFVGESLGYRLSVAHRFRPIRIHLIITWCLSLTKCESTKPLKTVNWLNHCCLLATKLKSKGWQLQFVGNRFVRFSPTDSPTDSPTNVHFWTFGSHPMSSCVVMIGVTGGPSSGKTTVSRSIAHNLVQSGHGQRICTVLQEYFYKDIAQPQHNFDHPSIVIVAFSYLKLF